MKEEKSQDILKAGTGFVVGLQETLRDFQKRGYIENLSAKFDHFECRMGEIKIYPSDISVDQIVRFENASDPNDNSILFAIRSKCGVRGVFVDSFGVYHTDLSPELERKLRDHPH